jgi:hypothetical protein
MMTSPIDGLALVDRQPAVVLEKVREFEFGNGQDVSFKGTAN